MNVDDISKALIEAKRFQEAALIVLKLSDISKHYVAFGCPETAACRRASMDLTRALARLRKAG